MAVQAINGMSPSSSQAPRSPAAQPTESNQPPSAQIAAPKQATSVTSTPQEEAMETYAETIKEALAGDQQAIRKLAAQQKPGANGEASTTTPSKGNRINVTA
jgi:hypothetical protein